MYHHLWGNNFCVFHASLNPRILKWNEIQHFHWFCTDSVWQHKFKHKPCKLVSRNKGTFTEPNKRKCLISNIRVHIWYSILGPILWKFSSMNYNWENKKYIVSGWMSNFSAISWRKQIIFDVRDGDDICFYTSPTRLVRFFIELDHWTHNLLVDMSPH